MTISVVIATVNRAALLAECLACLAGQQFEPGDEVIVVDNGSTDDTPSIIAKARAGFPVALHSLVEPRPGKSRAIARGLEIAAGDVLAFTDDDVNVAPDWLAAIRRTMSDPDVALAGGRVSPRWERRPPRWLDAPSARGRLGAPIALVDYGPEVLELGARTAIGANLSVRRSAFLQVGGFDADLGKLQGTLLSGEDHELCRRIQAAGLRAIYDPRLQVTHWVPATRMRIGYYLSWFFWSGITHAMLDGRTARDRRSAFGVPLYLVKRAATAGAGAVVAALAGNATRAVEQLIDVAFAAGYASRTRRLPLLGAAHIAGPRS
jgi:glycosyltransferase involved in cell wall biosynthesis